MLFETERCSINTLQKPDFDDVKQLFVNREVRKFLGGIREEDSIQVILESSLNHAFCWVVREKHSGAFIGLVSLDLHHDGIYQEISYPLPRNIVSIFTEMVGERVCNRSSPSDC